MGVRWSKIAVVAAAVAGALVAPAAASAAGEPDTGGYGSFRLEASNGYSGVLLAGSGPGYRRGHVVIWLFRRNAFVVYAAPATVTDSVIEADLGRLGRIDVEFAATGEKGRTAPACEPKQRVSYDKGSYVGKIELHGEEGYTEVSATSARFSLHPFIDLICGGYESGELLGDGVPGARLTVTRRMQHGRVFLQANKNSAGARVKLRASIDERRGRIQIAREIEFRMPGRVLDFESDLSRAVLAPSAPFFGMGTYRQDARPANRWTGSLAVDFPGRSNVSLTGARFHPNLVHARLTESTLRVARPNLSPWPSTKPSPTASAMHLALGAS